MNYIFMSPAFPASCTLFCEQLHNLGVNVLGIGDVPYDALSQRLKNALTEYYYVPTLEEYDLKYRAVAFFIHKYGRIDWLESLNEYWLPTDAKLRSEFSIAIGTKADAIDRFIKKSGMKQVFLEAGLPTARQHIVSDLEAGLDFVDQVGFPVIVKPDVGVGAYGAMKLDNMDSLLAFYKDLPAVPYVMEEFLSGDICTYDAIIDSHCKPLFESTCTYESVLDSIANDKNVHFYVTADLPPLLRELGRKTVRAFGSDRRFVHFEFIHLARDYAGIGKAGDYAVMEVNMRPAGGRITDMMNYAQSVDVFSIYAEMVCYDKRLTPIAGEHYLCAYAARKEGHVFAHSHDDIMARYGNDIVLYIEQAPIDWIPMGRYLYLARFKEMQQMQEFFSYVLN